MNSSAVVQAEDNARQDGAPDIFGRNPIPPANFLERWLLMHLNAIALAGSV